MKVLVDTCVFLDIFLKRDGFFNDSSSLLTNLYKGNSQVYISPTSLKDIYFFVNKQFHDKKKAILAINRIYQFTNKIMDINADDSINAMFMEGDFEDNIIIESAKRNLVDCIVTRNVKDYKNKGIPVFTPNDFNKTYSPAIL